MDFVDYKCLESLIIEGESLTATEGVKEFFGKLFNKKPKPNPYNNTYKPEEYHHYTDLSDKIKEMYPKEWEKERNLRKSYMKELIKLAAKVDKEFGKYYVGTYTETKILKALYNGKYDPESDEYLNSWYVNYYSDIAFLDDPLPDKFPKTGNDVYYSPTSFSAPICSLDLMDLVDCNRDNHLGIDDKTLYDAYGLIATDMETFIARNLKDYACCGCVSYTGDNDGGSIEIDIIPSDQMLDLAFKVTTDPEEKKGILAFKEYRKYVKNKNSETAKKEYITPKDLSAKFDKR